MAKYYIKRELKVFGPFSGKHIKAAVSENKVLRTDLLSNSPDGPWQKAETVSGLKFPSKTPPPPPQSETSEKKVLTKTLVEEMLKWEGNTFDNPIQESQYQRIEDDAFVLLTEQRGYILLQGITTLSATAISLLVNFDGDVTCSGLQELHNSDLARKLVSHSDEVDLSGLREVSDEIAEILCGSDGQLLLYGLTRLTYLPLARKLALQDTDLLLEELTGLSEDVAHALAQSRNILRIGTDEDLLSEGKLSLSDQGVATALSTHSGENLTLGLREISSDIASQLSQQPACLSLGGITSLSSDAAINLAKTKGTLTLGFVSPEIFSNIAKDLSAHKHSGDLVVYWRPLHEQDGGDRFGTLTEDIAMDVSNFDGDSLQLPYSTLTPAAAKILAAMPCSLVLWSIGELDPSTAEALKHHAGKLTIYGGGNEISISVEAATILAEHVGPLELVSLDDFPELTHPALLTHPSVSDSLDGESEDMYQDWDEEED